MCYGHSDRLFKVQRISIKWKLINTLLFTCQSKFSGLWFFIVLFVTSILLYVIEKYISRQWIQISIIIILIILNRVCFYRNIYLPFSLEECFLALPFMYVGSKTKLLFKYEKIIFLISVLTWCISFGIHMALGYASISLWNSDVQNVILYLLQGFCASYVLIFMVKYICSKTKISILEKLGNETAFMYGIHYYFLSMWLIVIEKNNVTHFYKYLLDVAGVFLITFCSYISSKIASRIKGLLIASL